MDGVQQQPVWEGLGKGLGDKGSAVNEPSKSSLQPPCKRQYQDERHGVHKTTIVSTIYYLDEPPGGVN